MQKSRIAISIYFFGSGLIFSSWASRIPSIKDSFHLNDAELGALLFALPLGALSALPISGWVVHKFGSKLVSTVALLLYSFSLYSISAIHHIAVLSVSLFLFGFIGNICNISMNAQGLSVQRIINGKPILSSLHGMWSIGAFVAAALSGLSMKLDLSTASHFLIISVLCIVVSLASSNFFISDHHDDEPKKIFALPNKELFLLGFICFCVAMTEGAMSDWSSLYYRMVLEDIQKVSTSGYTAFAFSMAIGRFLGDRLVHSFGYKRVLKMNGVMILIGMTIALSIKMPMAVIIGFTFVGLGVSSVFPIVYNISAKSKTMTQASAIAAVSSVGFTGFLFGPPIIGFIANETGLRFALGVIIILGFLIWLLSNRVKK